MVMGSVQSSRPPRKSKLQISISDLPSLPSTLVETLRLAGDIDTTVGELEEVVTRDQSLAARVLQVANSAFYGSRNIATITRAVQLLGIVEIQKIAASMVLAPQFETSDSDLLDGATLWRHSLACALWTEVVARTLKFSGIANLFTAGLMHDIGILVLARAAQPQLGQALQCVRDGTMTLAGAEKKFLDTHHARTGATVCAKWMLPPILTKLIAIHHSRKAFEDPHARVLVLAEHLAASAGMGEFPWSPPSSAPAALLKAMNLSQDDIECMLEKTEHIEQTLACFIL